MANVFKQVTEPNNRVNKSSFDLSFQNNLTMQFGYLYPCFVKKVAPGTKMTIKPTFGLNFMPMMFPVQTRMRARMSFYKVRCRSVWKDYKDWFGNLKPNLVKPYINFNTEERLKKMASTGSLGDYLGLPTTFSSEYGAVSDLQPPAITQTFSTLFTSNTASFLTISEYLEAINEVSKNPSSASVSEIVGSTDHSIMMAYIPHSSTQRFISIDYTIKLDPDRYSIDFDFSGWSAALPKMVPFFTTVYYTSAPGKISAIGVVTNSPNVLSFNRSTLELRVSFQFEIPQELSSMETFISCPLGISVDNSGIPALVPANGGVFISKRTLYFANFMGDPTEQTYFQFYISNVSVTSWKSTASAGSFVPSATIKDITLETSPYYNSSSSNKENQLMLDASFFRAYEAIYNAYFRDIRNNPYKINGQEEYNVFIPSDEGGEDNNLYELRRRNWEADFLTTAVPSPQQGRAPLVGITTYNDTSTLAFTAEDGKKYAVQFDYDKDNEEMKNISFQQLSDDAVVKEARNMMDLVASGISISDLRNVNAYTKFLELNMRKGYFYKDLVEGHFDTKVRYDELNMPEFIGGTAKDVFVNPVSQTVQTSQDGSYFGALGSYAGQASVQGTADNSISVYCDEETIIMGLISIVPVANYSQLLPKHFLHRELLDSYFPEFDNIGFQPILYNEVCPIQAYNDNPESLRELFGYQRPWYDYVASTDEVHGLFRTNLRNFLVNRVFDLKPTLSPDFLLVDPEQVNDIFSVTQTTDKILGQIWFDVTVNAPISRIAIPRLD